jgi:hypothetical protein
MIPPPLPYTLEDRTGLAMSSDFDDIYDRLFLRVSQGPQPQRDTTLIYNMTRRSSRHRDSLPLQRDPSVALEFGPNGTLGNVTFMQRPSKISIPMARYLRKTSIFGGSLSRKFVASDGREYKWSYRTVQGQEWSCTSEENYLVAHYDLKPPEARAYGVSGNILTIYEPFCSLAIELLASLTIMRFIAQNNL